MQKSCLSKISQFPLPILMTLSTARDTDVYYSTDTEISAYSIFAVEQKLLYGFALAELSVVI